MLAARDEVASQAGFSSSLGETRASLSNLKLGTWDEPLSEREGEALHLLAEGRTYQEIGQAMYVSVNTVKTHLRNVYAKLRVHTRRKAVARARELRFVD